MNSLLARPIYENYKFHKVHYLSFFGGEFERPLFSLASVSRTFILPQLRKLLDRPLLVVLIVYKKFFVDASDIIVMNAFNYRELRESDVEGVVDMNNCFKLNRFF